MKTRDVWLLLAIVGAVVPWYFLVAYFAQNQIGVSAFLAAAVANEVATAFAADLVISSVVFCMYMYSRRPVGPAPWPFIIIIVFIGLSCALPAYLWVSGRQSGVRNTLSP